MTGGERHGHEEQTVVRAEGEHVVAQVWRTHDAILPAPEFNASKGKLEPARPRYLRTEPGVGYRVVVD
jgi:hypothetical protein